MKTLLLVLLLVLPGLNSFAIGWADWQRDTPYGNYMYDAGGGTRLVFRKTHQEVSIATWYFYKGYTVGCLGKDKYFIADERTATLTPFDGRQDWETARHRLGLKPTWTRWYQDDWCFLDDLPLIMLLTFYISVPVLIVLAVIAYRAVVRERLNPPKPCTLVITSVALLLLVQYYLETHPVSV